MKILPAGCTLALVLSSTLFAGEPVTFDARTARDGDWSDTNTWANGRAPNTGDFVQVRSGHTVVYDLVTNAPVRMVHVAGTLTFSREKNTQLEAGLIKIEPGETTTEDGFDCHDEAPTPEPDVPRAALEIGTADSPMPADVTATIRLHHFKGQNPETLPAIVVCGGRWDVHGAPMNRTWVKLGMNRNSGDSIIKLAEPVTGWRVGDRVIVTTAELTEVEKTFRQDAGNSDPVGTEEHTIAKIEEDILTLDRALQKNHPGDGLMSCEIANLSRNVVIESADPDGVRGHTVYRRNSSGSISHAEFRHLGKSGVLGKYPIHFHLVRDTMRGSSVVGASVWDSHNRWVTIHGSDYLLVRDNVGYQSRGHGFFLEDATEQWNVLDRNLAVQAYRAKKLPKQVLGFDPNDGAGFWWANGRNTITRNVACENDKYGFHFELRKNNDFDPVLRLRDADGNPGEHDVRTIPFLRFEDNEVHGNGLYGFKFGDERHGSVHGDREHPFIVRNLRAWRTHYVLRPNIQFFLLAGLRVKGAVYGIYAPDYDAHVYRDIELNNVNAEPINRANDDDSIQYGDFTYDRITIANCKPGRDPLIQMACTAPTLGVSGHFRALTLTNSHSNGGNVVDLGGGPRNDTLENPVSYYFHDTPAPGSVTRVLSVKFHDALEYGDYRSIEDWTGPDVRAATVEAVGFPELLDPIDDLPPATMITSVRRDGKKLIVRGIATDNGEIATVTINGKPAQITAQYSGIADWQITLAAKPDAPLVAKSTDRAGNTERTPHELGNAPPRGTAR